MSERLFLSQLSASRFSTAGQFRSIVVRGTRSMSEYRIFPAPTSAISRYRQPAFQYGSHGSHCGRIVEAKNAIGTGPQTQELPHGRIPVRARTAQNLWRECRFDFGKYLSTSTTGIPPSRTPSELL